VHTEPLQELRQLIEQLQQAAQTAQTAIEQYSGRSSYYPPRKIRCVAYLHEQAAQLLAKWPRISCSPALANNLFRLLHGIKEFDELNLCPAFAPAFLKLSKQLFPLFPRVEEALFNLPPKLAFYSLATHQLQYGQLFADPYNHHFPAYTYLFDCLLNRLTDKVIVACIVSDMKYNLQNHPEFFAGSLNWDSNIQPEGNAQAYLICLQNKINPLALQIACPAMIPFGYRPDILRWLGIGLAFCALQRRRLHILKANPFKDKFAYLQLQDKICLAPYDEYKTQAELSSAMGMCRLLDFKNVFNTCWALFSNLRPLPPEISPPLADRSAIYAILYPVQQFLHEIQARGSVNTPLSKQRLLNCLELFATEQIMPPTLCYADYELTEKIFEFLDNHSFSSEMMPAILPKLHTSQKQERSTGPSLPLPPGLAHDVILLSVDDVLYSVSWVV